MCCLALSAGFIGPRFALLMWWIFGDKVDAAFSSFFWPLLGLLILPWTTIAYVLAWGPVYGVSGFWAGCSSRSVSSPTSRRTRRRPRKRATPRSRRRNVRVFGSVARGDDSGASDIDLLKLSRRSQRLTQRKPMWLMPVSTICGRRAAGR